MLTILSALVSLLSFRVRSRASLELELVALRHQVTVLRRQRPGPREAVLRRPAPLGVALPGLAAGLEHHDAGQAGNRYSMASQRLPPLVCTEYSIQHGRREPAG